MCRCVCESDGTERVGPATPLGEFILGAIFATFFGWIFMTFPSKALAIQVVSFGIVGSSPVMLIIALMTPHKREFFARVSGVATVWLICACLA